MSSLSSFRRKWPTLMKYAAIGCISLGMGAGSVSAQTPQSPPSLDELKARVERLEQQNQQLIELLQQRQVQPSGAQTGGSTDDVRKIVTGVLKEQEDKKKAEDEKKKKEEAEKGYEVGSNLSAAVRWDPNIAGFKLETPNKDFTLHIGGRIQYDTVFFTQDAALQAPTQIGNLIDGSYFRRVRMQLDGTAWEVFEYNFEYAFEGISSSIVNLDEMWAGITKVPFIGSIRVGHLKVPQGLEGDMVSSSKAMTFMERAAYTDAFYNNFAPGIWAGNAVMDQRATWAAMFYRTERGSNGVDFGDGEYAATGRVTTLPLYENNGRCLVHLGGAFTWRAAEKPGTELAGAKTINLQARPEMRDASGDFGNGVLPGDSVRMVSTGAMIASDLFISSAEALAIAGPLSFQAEWAFTRVTDVVRGGVTDDRNFHGGYAQVSYFLTGENRLYDKRLGRLGSLYVNPDTNFWSVRDEDGNYNNGLGAWELAMRYSYLNLNDGPVQGGVFQGWTAGLNWYLNTNCKVQFNYINDARWHRNGASPPGNISGNVQGFGIETQFFF